MTETIRARFEDEKNDHPTDTSGREEKASQGDGGGLEKDLRSAANMWLSYCRLKRQSARRGLNSSVMREGGRYQVIWALPRKRKFVILTHTPTMASQHPLCKFGKSNAGIRL